MKKDLKTFEDIREVLLATDLLVAILQETQDSVLELLKFMYEEDRQLRHAEAVKEAKKAAVIEIVVTVVQVVFYSFLTTMLLTAIFN